MKRWPAIVSPFLSSYACKSRLQSCHLCECRGCGFRFFDSRLTDEEIARLYAGYRGDDYFRARHSFEFWYSRAANDGIGKDAGEIADRKRNLAALLGERTQSFRTVLDYGGDRGQFIPDNIGTERYVYEISDAPAVDTVQRLQSVEGRQFDFVMLAHVLEHCSRPKEMLDVLRPLLSDQSILYLEVPYERPSLGMAGTSGMHAKYLELLLKSTPLLVAVDFYSTVGRVKGNLIPPLGLQKCSEHLNFFTESSLKVLLEKNGFTLLECGTASFESRGPISKILYGLARRAT